MFARHGLPESLTSDNGPQFISAEFAEYMVQQGIRHHKVTAKWPQANGEVERQNSSLLKRLQIAHAEKKNWKTELNIYLAAYRSLPHPTTGVSPAELLFGRKIRTKLPELSDVHVEQGVRDRDGEQKSKSKSYADSRRGARPSEVLPGDQVLVQQEKIDKLSTRFNPTPYTVVSKHGNSLIVQSQQGAQYNTMRHQACRKEQCQKQVKKRRNRFNSRVCSRNQMWLRPKFQLKDTQLPNQRFHSGDRRGKARHQVISRITIPDSERH